MSEQIIEVMNAMCEKMGVAIDWTAANIGPYLTELAERFIKYIIWTSVGWIAFMLVIEIVSLCLIPLWLKMGRKSKELRASNYAWDLDYASTWVGILGFSFLICWSIATVAVVGVQLFDIIEAMSFPEKTIIEYAASILNSGNR